MKQTAFMLALTLIGTVGVFVSGPFIGIAVYYLFAVLRPQYLWQWALPADVAWSQYVAVATLAGVMLFSLAAPPSAAGQRRLTGSHAAYLLFGAWLSLTYVAALDREVAWVWFVEYLKIFTMFAAAAVVIREFRQIWTLYIIAAIALVYIAYEANFLYVTARRVDMYHVGYGGLDNNGAGLMIAMGVPIAIYAWDGTRRWWRWLFAAGVPLMLHAVMLTYSRGAMVSLVAVAPLLLLRSRHRLQVGALMLALALMVPVMAGEEIRYRFFSVQRYEVDLTANQRMASWTAALRIANDHPVFGVGIRNANLLSREYGADVEGRTIHSQYLQLLADTGYPGLLLYLVALTSVWRGLRRTRRALTTRTDPEAAQMRSAAAGIEGALAVFCVGGLFLSLEVFELPYLLALLAVQLSVVAQAVRTAPTRTAAVVSRPRTATPIGRHPLHGTTR